MKFEPGQQAYLIENNRQVAAVKVLKFDGVFCTVICGGSGGFCIRATRLYDSAEAAEAKLKAIKKRGA